MKKFSEKLVERGITAKGVYTLGQKTTVLPLKKYDGIMVKNHTGGVLLCCAEKRYACRGKKSYIGAVSNSLIIVEGLFDMLTCYEADFNAVAVCGIHIDEQLISDLKAHSIKKVYILFDNDKAGRQGAEKAVKMFAEHDIKAVNITCKVNEDGLDVNDMLRKYGTERIIEILKGVIDDGKC